MRAYKTIKSKVMPLPLKDVDTDMIIPAQFMTSISREGYGENLFVRLRQADPQFPSNQEKYKGAEILVADHNFGCGSSREHAVWALDGAGFKAVVAKSFADIFSGNSAKNGFLLVVLPEAIVDRILLEGRSGSYELSIDLEKQTVSLPDGTDVSFDYNPFRKHCLLNGLDDIDYILSFKDEIKAFKDKSALTQK
ncbi:MAG: 3-isopropylmalate dehydratase small subunit [Candidatus Obscuribacterales bacterium]|nr:3-isopropylmalate dehydratase small subunit [Candidatus Obscuribacterales bacterium]